MSDLQPGRELDALVAEKVMGWTAVIVLPNATRPYWVARGRPPGGKLQAVPHFSTEMSAAWQVVEKLKEWFGDIEISGGKDGWLIETGPHEGESVWDVADTLPHAICLAALHAVGIDTHA